MKIIRTIPEMQRYADQQRREGKIIGFVPTMGYLHEGHLSLMRLARPRCDVLVVSIFVNPTQFGPNEDFDRYPRDFEHDERLCRQEQVDVVFYPDVQEMYPQPYYTYVNVEKLSETMCGASRPGHFRGVATVVTKLFNIVKPHLAVFGQKDYQQALIIQQMVKDLNFDIEILLGPIVREPDGLAMSSRNKYLSPEERQKALVLYRSLQYAEQQVAAGERDARKILAAMEAMIQQVPGVQIDYVVIVDGQTLEPVTEIRDGTLVALAVKVGQTRLIDNTVLRLPKNHST
ncbi:MAG: pantoate--beta-alanine ligase [Calditrichaeota bacterium]|nr:pantoate--beta-alanine ligase [Calditrichota bacterium]